MSNIFKIVPISKDSHFLMIHPNQSKLIAGIMQATKIHFGLQEMEITCKYLNTLKENEIGLSNGIIETLQLPLGMDYEISLQNESIIIGPYIGILLANSHDVLIKKIRKYDQIIKQYPLVRGVIVAFFWEGIDKKNCEVNGYIYNPSSKKWEEGTFPFPAVIVKRMKLSKKRQEFFKKIYGSRIFNTASIDKWKMYQRLSSNKQLLPHLPKTFLYEKPSDVINSLKSFRTIYVKPISGQQGVDIAKFIAESDQFSVKSRMNNINNTIHFLNENELLNYVKSNLKSKKYIIQQELDLEIEKNHLIDFRMVLVKDQRGRWKDVGMVGRRGVEGSVVSNISSGGQVVLGKTLLLTSFNLSEDEMLSFRQKMSEIAIMAVEEIDKYETIYKYGVDIGIDRNLHIWLIELNNRSPDNNIFSFVGDYETISKIKNSRLFYAKYLAGFPEENGNENTII